MSVGQVIGGRFRVDAVLGAGGMGVVVAATHLELNHRVAIKLLRDEMAERPTIVERFLREARAVVQLRTEHVCRVFDVARLESGVPYIVMELLEGADLGQVVARQPLPVTMAVEYVMQACLALAEAHAAGIIHRDLKPANLFVTRRPGGGPLIKVLDFGIAKALLETGAQLTHTHGAMGSPGYMSPEQLQSARDVDVRTDIWALGVTLYQLLSARLPFYRANPTEMAVRIAVEPPDPLDVDPALRRTVWRCLDKAPAARFASVAELAAALVPFGGPSARAIATLVSRIAAGPTAQGPVAAPVATGAYTAADSVIAPTAGPPISPTGAVRIAPTGASVVPAGAARRPRWWIAGVALVVVAGAAVALTRGLASPGATPVRDAAIGDARPGDAVTSADAVVVADAAVAPADAAPADAIVDARDPWEIPDAGPHDAGEPHPPKRGRPHPPVALPANYAGQMRQACQQILRPEMLDKVPPVAVAMCWCYVHDAAHAAAAIAKLSAERDRTNVRAQCQMLGTKLP